MLRLQKIDDFHYNYINKNYGHIAELLLKDVSILAYKNKINCMFAYSHKCKNKFDLGKYKKNKNVLKRIHS